MTVYYLTKNLNLQNSFESLTTVSYLCGDLILMD